MEIEEKLYDLFSRKLDEIEDRIGNRINPRWRSMARLQEEWADFLGKVPGLEALSKIAAIVVDEKEDHVRFRNPLVVGGNEGMLSLPRETAAKVVALGHIPQEDL